jgi:hypothetical protein
MAFLKALGNIVPKTMSPSILGVAAAYVKRR